ncbi:MAG: hypothetical protein QM749_04485 [Aquabacterium sp.]
MFKVAVATCIVAASCGAHAVPYVAVFEGVDSSSILKLTFDDASERPPYLYMPGSPTIEWNLPIETSHFVVPEKSFIDTPFFHTNGPAFQAWYETADTSLPITLDYSGTTVHLQTYGLGYRDDTLTLPSFDWTGIDVRKAGWSVEFYKRAMGMVFTATRRFTYEAYGAGVVSTDGPLTIDDVYGFGPWYDGIPYDLIQAAVLNQNKFLTTPHTESMRLVSFAPAVPEPSALEAVVAGLAVLALWAMHDKGERLRGH